MAQWVSLGSLVVTPDWTPFPNPAIQSQTFRALQNYSAFPLRYCQIAQFFPGPGSGGLTFPIRRIYPSTTAYIFTLPIPPELAIQQLSTRDILIRRPLPAYDSPQTVELQILY